MQRSLIAVVLCIAAQVAAADCVTAAPAAPESRGGADTLVKTSTEARGESDALVKTSVSALPAAPKVQARNGGELIKTAAAGTRDPGDGPRAGAAIARTSAQHTQAVEEEPQRSGTAMLLAALALMSGIALRRFGANK